MTDHTEIQPITDPDEVQRIQSLIEDVIDKPGHFKMERLVNKGWVVVPVESHSHFNEIGAEQLSQAMRSSGYEECFAIATEPLLDFPACFRVNTSKEGLMDFSWKCSHFNFVLIPEDRGVGVLCTVYDYFLVGGKGEFVRKAVGGSIKAAREEFNELASDDWWEGRLLEVARRYESLSSVGE